MRQRLKCALRALAHHRGPGSSTCPSDAARAVGGQGWRELMADTREVARELARSGQLEITQRGKVLDPDGNWHGPVRIRTPR
ncbi:S-adenosylmethionine tRNA ribosyltransferase [Mycobacterium sp. E2699]|nr:S-adenosylmethionine tRNA ribosyltransferase [Mycobacterium sp. E2699]OBI52792.1 S-adenosylmethionine tRNA ribosyltransferase [Mycobacterium sp. E787]